MSRVFANGLGNRGSISGRVIPKTQKWYLMPPYLTLSIITNGSKVKWSNPENGEVPSPTSWCSSYWNGSLHVTLDYSHQLYFYPQLKLPTLLILYILYKNKIKLILGFCPEMPMDQDLSAEG